jgi:hypothetical protein
LRGGDEADPQRRMCAPATKGKLRMVSNEVEDAEGESQAERLRSAEDIPQPLMVREAPLRRAIGEVRDGRHECPGRLRAG